MKSMKMAVLALMLIGFCETPAHAGENRIHGLLLGAGGGALVGQAIGRDRQATLIGTAVGGVTGYMVGNEMDRANHRRSVDRQVVATPPPAPPTRYSSNRPYTPDREVSHHSNRPDEVCREVVVVKERHGRYHRTVRTVCRERDEWRDDWRQHRRSERDRYGYNDRW